MYLCAPSNYSNSSTSDSTTLNPSISVRPDYEMAVPRLAIICSVMHLFLIFAYVTLLVIVSSHYEHRLNYTLTPIRQTVMTAVVNVVPQTFGIVSISRLKHSFSNLIFLYRSIWQS